MSALQYAAMYLENGNKEWALVCLWESFCNDNLDDIPTLNRVYSLIIALKGN